MSFLEQPSGQNRSGRRGLRRLRWLALGLALALVFLLGVAFGQALDDGPDPGGVTTSVRTLTPLPQQPPTRTVTVTITQP